MSVLTDVPFYLCLSWISFETAAFVVFNIKTCQGVPSEDYGIPFWAVLFLFIDTFNQHIKHIRSQFVVTF